MAEHHTRARGEDPLAGASENGVSRAGTTQVGCCVDATVNLRMMEVRDARSVGSHGYFPAEFALALEGRANFMSEEGDVFVVERLLDRKQTKAGVCRLVCWRPAPWPVGGGREGEDECVRCMSRIGTSGESNAPRELSAVARAFRPVTFALSVRSRSLQVPLT